MMNNVIIILYLICNLVINQYVIGPSMTSLETLSNTSLQGCSDVKIEVTLDVLN